MSKKETALARTQPLSPTEITGIFGTPQPLDGIELRLAQIKIAHQNQAFELPSGDIVKSFEGLILDIVNVNAWWAESFDESGGGTPPQCFSLDGIRPSALSESVQSETCQKCAWNKFGSDGRRGKACKNMKRVHIMFENENFPKRLTVPPTSLKSINIYGTSLADRGIPYQGVMTEFSLKQASNKDGIKYSELVLENKGFAVQSQEEFELIMQKRKDFYVPMREQTLEASEYTGEDSLED